MVTHLKKSLVNYQNDTWTREDMAKATEKVAKRIVDYIFEL